MTDESLEPEENTPAPKGGMVKPLLFGLIGAAALGGGGFFAVSSGMLDSVLGQDAPAQTASGGTPAKASPDAVAAATEVAFVPMESIMVSLAPGASAQHLRFSGQLEVTPGQEEAVENIMPRVMDVLNTYLRAVDIKDIEHPASATRLRAQMLRRIQVVAGEGMVRDLLVTEFVLN
ncbi:flagellar basal body-associated FliL family protein [Amaricoccus tamworthensis]|uniref:flagellar basal body-associated FliL family protein n=1 Tax=Amaricoccus tamworthensis TaxID=57002 RepID=UPI003C7BEB9B